MIKSIKEFFKDYAEVLEQCSKWYKKHWFGYIILTIVIVAIEYVWVFRGSIKDRIGEAFKTRLEKTKSVEEEKDKESE